MTRQALIGLGAGLASALMFIALIGGPLLAFPLFILSPLPIAIAGIGWGTLAGVLAAGAAGGIIAGVITPMAGLMFLVLLGAPMAWIAHLVGLSRPGEEGKVEWFPLSAIFYRAAIAAALALVATGLLLGYDPDAVSRMMIEAYQAMLIEPTTSEAPSIEAIRPLVALNVALLPVTTGTFILGILVLSAWLAARIVRRSGLLLRPWIPVSTASLPAGAVAIFGVATAASFAGGTIGHAAGAVSGSFGLAFALSGYGAMHVALAGNALRGGLLFLLYALSIFFVLPIIVMAAIGIADSLLNFKARRFAGLPSNDS